MEVMKETMGCVHLQVMEAYFAPCKPSEVRTLIMEIVHSPVQLNTYKWSVSCASVHVGTGTHMQKYLQDQAQIISRVVWYP